jgi:hypothetical protein
MKCFIFKFSKILRALSRLITGRRRLIIGKRRLIIGRKKLTFASAYSGKKYQIFNLEFSNMDRVDEVDNSSRLYHQLKQILLQILYCEAFMK